MTAFRYTVEAECEGLRAAVTINGGVVFHSYRAGPRGMGRRIEPWLREGRNELAMSLARLDEEVESEHFLLSVYKSPADRTEPQPMDLFLRYRWSANEAPLPSGDFATVFQHGFHVPTCPGPWAWEEATPFANEDRGDVIEAVRALHRAMAAGQTELVMALLGIRTEELSRGLDLDQGEAEGELAAYFESFFRVESWSLAPLAPDLVALPEADGRMVRVVDPSGAPPITGRTADEPFAFEVTLAKLDGAWLVVR
jgi:hypothetical protein